MPTPLANALAQYAPPKQTPSTPLANALMEYAARVKGDFQHGLDESAQGFGEMMNGQFATGVPRTFLGGLGWMGSPVSGAVSPLLNPVLQPVAQGVHDYVGKPVENATGYPADLTTELALALALPKALHGAGKVVNHSVPYLASLGDAVGKHIGVPEGSYMAGPLPLNRYKAAGLRSQLEPLEASLKKALLAKDATQAAKIREKLNGVRSEISRLDPGGPALDSAASDAILANHLDQSPISSPVGGGSGKVEPVKPAASQSVDEYAMSHRPPMSDSGAPLHDVTGGGNFYPDDVYSHKAVQYYGTGSDAMDHQTISLVHQMRNKPNATVTIYRAVPHTATKAEQIFKLEQDMKKYMARGVVPAGAKQTGSDWYNGAWNDLQALKNMPDTVPENVQINRGDWVTINRAYAKDHGESSLRGGYKIISKKVKAKDIYTNGDSIHEWGYDPKD